MLFPQKPFQMFTSVMPTFTLVLLQIWISASIRSNILAEDDDLGLQGIIIRY
jgi:hypothetical protein